MASTTSTRIWRITKAAGRPFPSLSSDDVMDYLITEAVAMKIANEDKKAQKEAEKQAQTQANKQKAMQELNKFR